MHSVREIWAADADPELINPLTSFYPYGVKIGTSKSLAFSSQLDVISPESVYDKIDYKGRDMSGEELYDEIKEALIGGFKGGQQITKEQASLLQAHSNTVNPQEDVG